jgi:photosynthetic reaction center cytochrome c subunit
MIRSLAVRALVVPLVLAATLAGCERPPIVSTQNGFRGTGMNQFHNPRLIAENAALHAAPAEIPPIPASGPKASEAYQNVKVLGDLSVTEFTRLMIAMTQWVSPQQGCNYCHNPQNLADDSVYTKVVARRMIEMTRHVNADWKSHVGDTGVTCYTCHRGQPVPAQVWYAPSGRKHYARSILGDLAEQNLPAPAAGLSSLPFDPFTHYLKDAAAIKPIRVNGNEALARFGEAGNNASTKQTEFTYSLMMHMSQSLGVNCTYCHNTRGFQFWEESPPARATAWHGIRMAGDLNAQYLTPLTKVFPPGRLGPQGDVAKVNCATCHQGVSRPLNGASVLKAHPELAGTPK